ncbi:hypothetical protein GX51_06453 [Blastomyces parvus]|uniref:Rhodopsin domain-containing protein n=1 Tax=Blastomyces parvus TaxID=2060905 RepID=A0A2B7WRB1_9EURO|nr:hypothetical protein GX51_06453 [Blastomyces parvus]
MGLFVDYGDVPDISAHLVYPSLVFSIVTPLFVIARFVSRRILTTNIGADDWVILTSSVFAETVSIQMIIICQWAFGKHKEDVMHLYFFAQILYKVNIGLTKISILLLYIRVFVRPWFTTTCWACIGIVTAFTIGTCVSSVFQCSPVAFAFDKSIPGGGKCINMTAFWYANAVFNISTDFIIVGLPVPVIAKLQLPTRTKIALCGVFTVGVVVCVTSILRITTLDVATSHLDTPWTNIGSSMWTVIESNLGIICACLPPLWRPLSVAFPRVFGRFNRATSAKQSSYNRTHGSGGRKMSCSVAGDGATAAANAIQLQSIERQRRKHDVSWMTTTKSSDEEGEEERNETAWRGSGSQDRIMSDRGTKTMNAEKDSPGLDQGRERATDSHIKKITQFSIQYDEMSDGEEREMAYNRLGLRPPRV